VAGALELRFGSNGNIHCWRPQLHQNGDRTASVGIWKISNKVKCFGCEMAPLGPLDLVMAVLNLSIGQAARWIAERLQVPELPAGTHLAQPERRIFEFGKESEIGLLVQSGLWAELSSAARSMVPVMLELAERVPGTQNLKIQISYLTIQRFSGLASPNAVRDALQELQGIFWLRPCAAQREPGAAPLRATGTYLITPRSDELLELAHAHFREMRAEIDIQKELRGEARKQRKNSLLTK
jgi:hypothetical protein